MQMQGLGIFVCYFFPTAIQQSFQQWCMQHFRNRTLRKALFEGLCLYFVHGLRHVRKKHNIFWNNVEFVL